MPSFFTRFSPPPNVGFSSSSPSLTLQSDLKDSLVENVLARHVAGLERPRTPIFGDFSHTPKDFAEAYEIFSDASERFSQLPSEVRDRFANDPLKLLTFLSDPRNREEAIRLNLVTDRASGPVEGSTVAVTPLDGIRPGDTNSQSKKD